VRDAAQAAVEADFPQIDRHGSYPVSELKYGPAFAALLDEIQSPSVRGAFERKFGLDLSGRPTMVTVRGQCHAKDGRIHSDSKDKIITVLIYLNRGWDDARGRLRILRSATDLENYAAEVPPTFGTLLAFRRSDRSFHGHHRYVGRRRSIQLNWVTGDDVVQRERSRHRLSAWLKRRLPVL
jgi:SM-20-related protein